MASIGKKISELGKDTQVTGEELIPIMDLDGVTKAIAVSDIIKLFGASLSDVDKTQNEIIETQTKQIEDQQKQINDLIGKLNGISSYTAKIDDIAKLLSDKDKLDNEQQSYITANASKISDLVEQLSTIASYTSANSELIKENIINDESQQELIEQAINDLAYHASYHSTIDINQQIEINELKEKVENIPTGEYIDPWEEFSLT